MLFDELLWVACGDEDQLFFGARQGDVEHAHLLGKLLAAHGKGNCVPGERRVFNHTSRRPEFKARAEPGMDQHRGIQILQIKGRFEVCYENYREFQPFGLVDAHDLYSHSRGFRRGWESASVPQSTHLV